MSPGLPTLHGRQDAGFSRLEAVSCLTRYAVSGRSLVICLSTRHVLTAHSFDRVQDC